MNNYNFEVYIYIQLEPPLQNKNCLVLFFMIILLKTNRFPYFEIKS